MLFVYGQVSGVQLVTSIESVSPAQLGTKAYRCCQLSLNNFNVPRVLIIPADVCATHMHHLGLQKHVNVALKNPGSSSAVVALRTIRQSIQESSLGDSIRDGIRQFTSSLDGGVSVRSSALSEDTSGRSAAGQYATVLNCLETNDIERAILECWSSLWTPSAARYRVGAVANGLGPSMAVMIMEMIDSIASGVLFTQNPVTGMDEFVVEAVWGLGVGLGFKGMTPDRLVLDSRGRRVRTEVEYKRYQFRLAGDRSGISKTDVPPENRRIPVVSDEQAANLCNVASKIADLYHGAQDIEWAADALGSLWILQCREITSAAIPLPAFLPPGPGEWRIIDHIAHPGTRCFSEYYYLPMERGWNEEAAWIGTVNRVKIREVNGFMYYQMSFTASGPELSTASNTVEGYWKEKRFLSALRLWDESIKPSAVEQLTALQDIRLSDLSDTDLIEHLERCFAVTRQMVKNHHRFTYSAFIPTGDFVRAVCEWTEREAVDVLGALAVSNPNRLLPIHRHPVIQRLLDALNSNIEALYLLTMVERDPQSATRVFEELLTLGGDIQQGLQFLLKHCGYRIASGYDIAGETFVERLDLLLKSIKSMLNSEVPRERGYGDGNGLRAIRDSVPNEKKPAFDEMLNDACEMERLRNERGMYTDLWAIGVLRHAFLEAGRRLVQKGVIDTFEVALEASFQELVNLLRGIPAVPPEVLQRRAHYRTLYSVTDAPAVLGEPPTTRPDVSRFTPSLARTMAAVRTAVSLAVEHVQPEDGELKREGDILVGVPASRGMAEGTARVVSSDDQIRDLDAGDIVVVYQMTAAFNAVLPLVGGIVAQSGGVLSHPAILAREHGIPCVVGCSGAMESIETGMRIRVDGAEGQVEIISEDAKPLRRLEALKCEYYGPMQGRNRHRVLNHVDAVCDRLAVVEAMRKDGRCPSALEMHFNDSMSTERTIGEITAYLKEDGDSSCPWISQESLKTYMRRHHVEFHPCDACNLRCSGCTYFQDTAYRSKPVSFPFDQVGRICSTMRPKAITLVGGGEPTLYSSGGKRLGDLIYALGRGVFGCAPVIGLITNGTLWPPGDRRWHRYLQWIRFSLDASTAESYARTKGKNYFQRVIDNVFRVLRETTIPQVGVGFLYHPGNIVEAGAAISLLAKRVERLCPDQLHRFNIQFRPWRPPRGRPSVKEHTLSQGDVDRAAAVLLEYVDSDSFLEQFVKQNTNIAVNLLCAGARETAQPFSECFFGLAKTVIRADGSLYPCFRTAAREDPLFYQGNLLRDSPSEIALRELHVATSTTRRTCVPEYDKCLFCVFNNILEKGIAGKLRASSELAGDYFF